MTPARPFAREKFSGFFFRRLQRGITSSFGASRVASSALTLPPRSALERRGFLRLSLCGRMPRPSIPCVFRRILEIPTVPFLFSAGRERTRDSSALLVPCVRPLESLSHLNRESYEREFFFANASHLYLSLIESRTSYLFGGWTKKIPTEFAREAFAYLGIEPETFRKNNFPCPM